MPDAQAPPGTTFSELMQFVDHELVRALWSKTFDGFGPHGSRSIRDEATLVWICDRVREAALSYRAPHEVAGVALCLIVTKHPFMDCNHRTGWLLCQTIMELAGYELVRPTNEVVDFVRSIDRLDLEEQKVIEWVERSFLRLG